MLIRLILLGRVPNDSEALPEELKTPVGIADDLRDSGMTTAVLSSGSRGNDGEGEKKQGETKGQGEEERLTGEEMPRVTVRVSGSLS